MPVFDSVLSAQDNPTVLGALGAVGDLVAPTLLRLLRRVRRIMGLRQYWPH